MGCRIGYSGFCLMAFSITNSGAQLGTNSNSTLGDALANFSMSFWLKSTSAQNTSSFLAQKENGGQNAGWFIFVIPSTGQLSLGTNAGGFQKNATTNFYDGNWHNLIVAYDGAVGVTGYLDGSPLTFGAGAGGTPLTNASALTVGAASSLSGQYYGVRFYNVTLSSGDATLINAGGNPNFANLLAEWPVVEGSGTVFIDVTGNGNTLTYNTTPTPFSSSDIPPVFQTGSTKRRAAMLLAF
jgi:hypothetical protein